MANSRESVDEDITINTKIATAELLPGFVGGLEEDLTIGLTLSLPKPALLVDAPGQPAATFDIFEDGGDAESQPAEEEAPPPPGRDFSIFDDSAAPPPPPPAADAGFSIFDDSAAAPPQLPAAGFSIFDDSAAPPPPPAEGVGFSIFDESAAPQGSRPAPPAVFAIYETSDPSGASSSFFPGDDDDTVNAPTCRGLIKGLF